MKTLKQKLAAEKIHKFLRGADCRHQGQTEFEYEHTAVCGYVRNLVTRDDELVTCKHCIKQIEK